MRTKELRVVVTFHTTAQAIAAERLFKERGIAGRLIPVPRQISAGCGLAWSAPAGSREELCGHLSEAGIAWQEMRELMI